MTDQDSPDEGHYDFTGLKCPLPVLKLRRLLKDVMIGEQVSVLADDPAAPLDFSHFCETSGHELLSSTQSDGVFCFVIKKKS